MSFTEPNLNTNGEARATTDRMDDLCFGDGAALKARALEEATLLLG